MNDLKSLHKVSIRGVVQLQSSSNIASFFITLFIIFRNKVKFEGSFNNEVLENFVRSLNEIGVSITKDSAGIIITEGDNTILKEVSLVSQPSTNFLYFLISVLSLQGFVEVTPTEENLVFVNLCKYLGFKVEKNNKIYKIFNVVPTPKNSLTFHENNLDYFLVSTLLMFLSNNSFSIATPQIDYNVSIVLDILKKLDMVSSIDFGDFVKIQFTKEIKKSTEKIELEIPGDATEFIFWNFLSAITGGEIKIIGQNSKYFAETLKLLSGLGVGFEAVSETEFKIWGSADLKSEKIEITDNDPHLEFTKLCLLVFTLVNENSDLEAKVLLDSKKYKNFISDLNMLGCEIKVEENNLLSVASRSKFKSGDIYISKNCEYESYAKLLFALGTDIQVDLKNITNLLIFNSDLLLKLKDLGYKLEYATDR